MPELRIDRAQHRMRRHHDLVGREGDERPTRHRVVRDEDRDLSFAVADGTRDLRRRQDQPAWSVEDEVDRHFGIGHHAGADHVLGVVDVDVAHKRKSEQAHRLLPVDEQDDAGLA